MTQPILNSHFIHPIYREPCRFTPECMQKLGRPAILGRNQPDRKRNWAIVTLRPSKCRNYRCPTKSLFPSLLTPMRDEPLIEGWPG